MRGVSGEGMMISLKVILTLLAIVINVFTVVLIARSRKLKQDTTSIVIASLSVCDLGHGVFMIGASVLMAFLDLDVDGLRRFALYLGCVFIFFGTSASWHLALISVIKCAKISNPLSYWTVLSDRVQTVLLAVVWAFSLVVALPPLFVDYRFMYAREIVFITVKNMKMFSINIVSGFGVPAIIILASNLKIFHLVRTVQRSTPAGDRVQERSGDGFHCLGRSLRSAKNIFIICSVYLSVYFQLIITNFVHSGSSWYYYISGLLYMSNTVFNSLLYILLHKTVRQEVRKLLGLRKNSNVVDTCYSLNYKEGGRKKGCDSTESYLGRCSVGPQGQEMDVQ